MKILVVVNREKVTKLIEKYLSKKNNEIFLAEKKKEAINIASDNDIDLMLVDDNIGSNSDCKICDKLKNEVDQEFVLIFLTSKSKMQDIEKAFQYGADECITKPVKPAELWPIIKRKLDRINQ